MIGHLGSRISALLDGQLPPDEEERAWQHVTACPECFRAVEREGWVKSQLATLSIGEPATPASLKGNLLLSALSPEPIRNSGRSRVAWGAVGGGAVGAAVVGLLALGPVPLPTRDQVGTPVTTSLVVPLVAPSAVPSASPSSPVAVVRNDSARWLDTVRRPIEAAKRSW